MVNSDPAFALTEKLNSISNEVFALEQLINTQRIIIQEMEQSSKHKDDLIKQVAPDIEWQESHLTMSSSERMRKIIETYRKIVPKPTTQEG